MQHHPDCQKIALIGGGPAALFLFQSLLAQDKKLDIHVFERWDRLGCGMPYSKYGANEEHVTNVSGNEIPKLPLSVAEWLEIAPGELLETYHLSTSNYNDYKVLPRLLFGEYLSAQFEMLIRIAKEKGIPAHIHLNAEVMGIRKADNGVSISIKNQPTQLFDKVVICTGHTFPQHYEGKVTGYYDSPYPPSKLCFTANHTIGIKGASLTAVDAIRTLARQHGHFEEDGHLLSYTTNPEFPHFKIVMHSRSGLLPAIRFHLEDPQLSKDTVVDDATIAKSRALHNGFLPLDEVFDIIFKESLKKQDPAYYEKVKDLTIEAYVEAIMNFREGADAFALFRAEYGEADRSIGTRHSIFWKEALATLSFALNHPAKYLSAEDMLRLQKTLMPLISVVIAFVPQSSCRELIALHQAGRLELLGVGQHSKVKPGPEKGAVFIFDEEDAEGVPHYYETFIDATGQPHLSFEDFPFKQLAEDKAVTPALLSFAHKPTIEILKSLPPENLVEKDGAFYLKVPGVAINDHFQAINETGDADPNLYIMAVPLIAGFNPDYSGLDFCESAANTIAAAIAR